ncbi:MAG: hypothetical protein ACRCST_00675 [Turicibacter sp.]
MKTSKVQTMIPGPIKFQTLEQFVAERNRLLRMAEARTRSFNDKRKNYYWYQLNNLEQLNPEFHGLGRIMLKKDK